MDDQGANKCKHFKLPALSEEGRGRYKLEQHQWICSNNHVNEGVEDGKKTPPCSICKETFEDRGLAYLSSRLSDLGLDARNGTANLFCKSGQPASIPFDQFLKILFGSHGQPGSGIRRQPGVSARFGDLTHAIQISQVRRRIRTASPGQEGPSLDESVEGLNLRGEYIT